MTGSATGAGTLLAGRYLLGDLLGEGGMATVHRARDERLGREVAVKLFRPDVADARDLRRIESEIRVLAGLNHPSLVTLHDATTGEAGEAAFLVLELIDGPNLAELLRDRPVTAVEYARLLSQVADALAYIGSRGVVHRDVKPENILVTTDEDGALRAKLADLGIARIADESRLTTAGMVIGTARYLSPEQVSGSLVGPPSDVYSLGIVLLEGLTGRAPFPGTGTEQAIVRTVRPPALPGGLTAGDADLLGSMTAVDPADRPPAKEVRDRLLRWASVGPFPATSSPAPPAAPAPAPDDDLEDDYEDDDYEAEDYEAEDYDADGDEADPDGQTEVLPIANDHRTAPRDGTGTSGDRTAVLPVAHDSGTAVLPAAHDSPTAVLPAASASPTAVLPAAHDGRTALLPHAPVPQRTVVLPAAPVPGPPPHGAVPRPPAAPRSRRRHVAWYVLVVLLLAGGSAAAVAAWPTITAWIEPGPAEPPPVYPAVEGDLGSALTSLGASIEGPGLTDELTLQLREDVLAVATAAAVTDYPSAVTTLEVLAAHVDQAAIADQVTSARYREILTSIETVRGQLETAIAEEQAELQRIQEEQERLEQEQQEAENRGIFDGLRERLDQLGRDLQRQIERWTGEAAAQG